MLSQACWSLVSLLALAACTTDRGIPPTPSATPTTDTANAARPATTITTVAPSPAEAEGWILERLAQMDSNALVQLATGPMGTLVATLQPAGELGVWFQPEGDGWHHHQLSDSSVGGGGPLIAVGPSQLLIIEVGDVEGRARGTGSTPVVWISTDGLRWESHQAGTLATASYLFDLVATSHGWIATGQLIRDSHDYMPAIFSSADGVSWELEEAGRGSGTAQTAVVREEEILVGGSEGGRPALWHSQARRSMGALDSSGSSSRRSDSGCCPAKGSVGRCRHSFRE